MQSIERTSTKGASRGGRRRAPSLVPVALAALACLAFGSASCGSTSDPRTVGVYTLAIGDNTPPAYQAMGQGGGVDAAIYEVQVPITLPLREKPTLPGDAVKPYDAPVWYGPRDVQVQVSYVVTNLGESDVVAEILVDGWNEFIRYTPKVTVDAEGNVSEDLSTNGRRVIVPAQGRVRGVFSYDDMERIAMDLAAIMNGAPNPFHIVEPHTRLLDDPTTKGYVPAVIDGLTGFDLSLRTTYKVKLAVEATVEVVDHGGYLVPEGSASNAADIYPSSLRPYRPRIAPTTGP